MTAPLDVSNVLMEAFHLDGHARVRSAEPIWLVEHHDLMKQ